MKNEHKKITWIDQWYRWYVKQAAHRMHKSDKKYANDRQRAYDKKLIREETKDIEH